MTSTATEPRSFTDKPAVRERVPLLIGIFGASSSGKTYSALRLATGIQSVSGGDIIVIDTESKRACHYAGNFKFRHIEFSAPFGSLDYLAAIKHCVKKSAGVVVVDSMSHEHEGDGGYLVTHEKEVERMGGDDPKKANRVKFGAWIKPANQRRQLINGILQLNTNFVFCFRAKEKLKIRPGQEPLELGWMPIAGEEFLFEMTATALLYPGSNGVPTWNPEAPGEKKMRKLPQQFANMLNDGQPLNESHGQKLAEWARGSQDPMLDAGRAAATKGTTALQGWWSSLNTPAKERLKKVLDDELKEAARLADESAAANFDHQPDAPEDAYDESDKQLFADECRERAAKATCEADIRAIADDIRDKEGWLGLLQANQLRDEIWTGVK